MSAGACSPVVVRLIAAMAVLVAVLLAGLALAHPSADAPPTLRAAAMALGPGADAAPPVDAVDHLPAGHQATGDHPTVHHAAGEHATGQHAHDRGAAGLECCLSALCHAALVPPVAPFGSTGAPDAPDPSPPAARIGREPDVILPPPRLLPVPSVPVMT